MSYRHFILHYESYLLTQWDHTSNLSCLLFNINITIQNLVSKKRLTFKNPSDFHPYRNKPKQGMRLTSSNLVDTLKPLAKALVRQRH